MHNRNININPNHSVVVLPVDTKTAHANKVAREAIKAVRSAIVAESSLDGECAICNAPCDESSDYCSVRCERQSRVPASRKRQGWDG